MKKNLSNTGITLIELIIAVSLISIVLLGIFAVNNVLSNNNQDYGQRYLVKSETQTTLDNILNNATQAIGSASIGDEGILLGSSWGDSNSFCIHQNPNNSGDTWLCYTWFPSPNFQINSCTRAYVPGGDPRNAGSCTLAASTFVGSANSISSPAAPTLSGNMFTITIQNCLNNTATSCNNPTSGTSQDPANNPEISVTGSVEAPQISTG